MSEWSRIDRLGRR